MTGEEESALPGEGTCVGCRAVDEGTGRPVVGSIIPGARAGLVGRPVVGSGMVPGGVVGVTALAAPGATRPPLVEGRAGVPMPRLTLPAEVPPAPPAELPLELPPEPPLDPPLELPAASAVGIAGARPIASAMTAAAISRRTTYLVMLLTCGCKGPLEENTTAAARFLDIAAGACGEHPHTNVVIRVA